MKLQQRWIDFIYRTATGTRSIRTLLTPIGVIVFGAFTAMFVLSAIAVDVWAELPPPLPEGLRLLLAVPVTILGLYVTGWSVFHFLRAKGTPVPLNPPPRLVTSGPYRYSRNPMLAGVFLMLFGLGFAMNSFSLVILFVPLFMLINLWELKRIEEPELEKRLGDEYIEYKSHTPMFVPRLWKREG